MMSVFFANPARATPRFIAAVLVPAPPFPETIVKIVAVIKCLD
jgi:hypothetical protein